MQLNAKEKDILQCLLDGWAESDGKALHGHISYADVDTLRLKLGLESPPWLAEIMTRGAHSL